MLCWFTRGYPSLPIDPPIMAFYPCLCDFIIFIEIVEIEAALQLEVLANLRINQQKFIGIFYPTNMRISELPQKAWYSNYYVYIYI